jgi:hypothetical protein
MSTAVVLNCHNDSEIVGTITVATTSVAEQDVEGQDPFLELSLTLETENVGSSKIFRTSSFNYEGLLKPILINEDTTGGCGGKTWEAADVTCNYLIWKYLNTNGSAFQGKSIIELGSGTGLVGLVLGAICNPSGAKEVVITDQL